MFHKAHIAHEQARWMRHDAARWVRPDAARFLIPGTRPEDVYPALKRKYSPNQPRVPAGNPDGGQWTDGSGSGRPRVFIDTTDWGSADEVNLSEEIGAVNLFDIGGGGENVGHVHLAQIDKSITDADGFPYYDRGGHHEMPQGVYKKWDLQPETRRVFDGSTTGSLPQGKTVETPEGILKGHYWDGAGGEHDVYNGAVRQLSERFMRDRGITPESMTPEQARELLAEIRNTDDPTIRNFNRGIRMLRRIYRLFRGRE